MGGGAAMRTAGKFAGLGVFSGGVRGPLSSGSPAAQSLRNISRPVAATISSSKAAGSDVAEAQKEKTTWEMVDDWELAGGVEDLLAESPETMSRVVFGGVPSLEEAKEATFELKDALDKIYLSSPKSSISEHEDPVTVVHVSSLPLLANSEHFENKSCISSDPKSTSVPQHAIQAFKLLSESTAAQTVVASIACDSNVWNAVLKNDALVEFIQTQKTNNVLQDQGSSHKFEKASDSSQVGDTLSEAVDSGSLPMDFFQTIKHTILSMVNNVGDFLQSIFGFSAAEKTSAEGDARATVLEKTLGASFVGLAIMVVMVVLLKRA